MTVDDIVTGQMLVTEQGAEYVVDGICGDLIHLTRPNCKTVSIDLATVLNNFRLKKLPEPPKPPAEITAGSIVRLKSSPRPFMTVMQLIRWRFADHENTVEAVRVAYFQDWGMDGKLQIAEITFNSIVAVTEEELKNAQAQPKSD